MRRIEHRGSDKFCTTCKLWKNLTEFGVQKRRWDGVRYKCKECEKGIRIRDKDKLFKGRKILYKKNRKLQKIHRRSRFRMTKLLFREKIFDYNDFYAAYLNRYQINVNEYADLLEIQGNTCKICGKSPKTKLAVDHCHKTNKVRGLLCNRCNSCLGFVNDQISLLENMIRYIQDNSVM